MSLPNTLHNVKKGQRIIEYVCHGEDYTSDKDLTNGMFEPTGPRELKSEAAFILRHMRMVCPQLGGTKLNELLSYAYVLFKNRPPTEADLPSASTVRNSSTRLNNLDEYELTQDFVALAEDFSPCGNKRVFGLISDGTKHGGHDKVQVVILTCDKQGKVTDRTDPKMSLKERYAFEPFFVLGTTSPSIESNSEGNSSLNIDVLNRLVPDIAKDCFGMMGTDNADDARKERRKTGEKFNEHLHEEGLHNFTYRHGVTKRLKELGDFFHIDQLINK